MANQCSRTSAAKSSEGSRRREKRARLESSITEEPSAISKETAGMRLDEFWTQVGERPGDWPCPQLDDKKEGAGMLRAALLRRPSFTDYGNSLSTVIKSRRNYSEIVSICNALDALFSEMGPEKAKDSITAEFLIRRLEAVRCADRTGKWDQADIIEGHGGDSLMSFRHKQRVKTQLKTDKALGAADASKSSNPAKAQSPKATKPAAAIGGGAAE